MTYQQCLDWLFSQLPMYQRTGSIAYKADIGNIVQATERLGNPHRNFKSIHIAGTNGKGSVCSMIASAITEAGYKTGLFTSPHLLDFRERIRIDGNKISKENVIDYLNLLEPILLEPENLYDLMKLKKNWNLERYIKLHLKQKNANYKIIRGSHSNRPVSYTHL